MTSETVAFVHGWLGWLGWMDPNAAPAERHRPAWTPLRSRALPVQRRPLGEARIAQRCYSTYLCAVPGVWGGVRAGIEPCTLGQATVRRAPSRRGACRRPRELRRLPSLVRSPKEGGHAVWTAHRHRRAARPGGGAHQSRDCLGYPWR